MNHHREKAKISIVLLIEYGFYIEFQCFLDARSVGLTQNPEFSAVGQQSPTVEIRRGQFALQKVVRRCSFGSNVLGSLIKFNLRSNNIPQ